MTSTLADIQVFWYGETLSTKHDKAFGLPAEHAWTDRAAAWLVIKDSDRCTYLSDRTQISSTTLSEAMWLGLSKRQAELDTAA